jgi:hypothetical protein
MTWSLPYKLGLMAAAFSGIAVGVLLERRQTAHPHDASGKEARS